MPESKSELPKFHVGPSNAAVSGALVLLSYVLTGQRLAARKDCAILEFE
jgi:hypothetical protein